MVEVQDNDVLCGRGGATNNHAGNRHFRELVSSRQPAYLAARKRDKKLIAQCIVDIVRQRGGRFLKRDYVDGLEDWVEIGDKKAAQKTAQALREGLDVWGRAKERSVEEENEGANKRPARTGGGYSMTMGMGRAEGMGGQGMPPTNYNIPWSPYGSHGYYPSPTHHSPSQPPPLTPVYHPESSHYATPLPPNPYYTQQQQQHHPPHPYTPDSQQVPYHPWQNESHMPQVSPHHSAPPEPLPPTPPHHTTSPHHIRHNSHTTLSPTSPLSPSSTIDHTAATGAGCTCKKSLCLKLYCQCFAASKVCNSDESSCRCVNCHNKPDYAHDISRARSVILRKNPMAFQTKFRELGVVAGGSAGGDEMTVGGEGCDHGSYHGATLSPPPFLPTTPPSWSQQQQQHQPSRYQPPLIPLQHHPNNLPRATLVHKLGCKCRKTNCIKKYCECFHGGVRCGEHCRCLDCKNRIDTKSLGDDDNVPRNMVRVMGGVRSERGRKRGLGFAAM